MSFSQQTSEALARALRTWKPPTKLLPSKWIEREVVLPQDETATPGRYRFSRYEFLREIADAFVDPDIEDLIVRKCSQVGWTTLFTLLILYGVAHDPSRSLVVCATKEEGEIFSKDRLDPIAKASRAVSEVIRPAKSRDANNKILHKKFPGGAIKIVGANSPSGLASYPAKRSYLDEVDRYPASAGDEGTPYRLIRKRNETYLKRGGKILAGSTPDIEGFSEICRLEAQGDQRRWLVRCHHCREEQELDFFRNVVWQKDDKGNHLPETAAYVCHHCGGCWSDIERLANVASGRWSPTATPKGKVRSYCIPGLASPDITHAGLAIKWLSCASDQDRKVFFNTDLGLPWKERGEAPDGEKILGRLEDWPADRVPGPVVFLSCGIDVQGDRIESRVWGFSRDRQSFLIERKVIEGNLHADGPWNLLTTFVNGTWRHEGGAYLSLARVAIDTGHHTLQVCRWVKGQDRQRVMAIKGDGKPGALLIRAPRSIEVSRNGKPSKTGVKPWMLNTDPLKAQLYGFLRLPRPAEGEPFPPGYVHLSKAVCDAAEIDQLTAEHVVVKIGAGNIPHRRWERRRPGMANEALDCRCYAHAAAIAYGLDRFTDRQWDEMEASLGIAPRERAASPPARATDSARPTAGPDLAAPETVNRATGRPRGGFWAGRR